MLAARLDDPCVNICRLDAAGKYCQGCRRTPIEIGRWPRLTAEERARLLEDIARRQPRGA